MKACAVKSIISHKAQTFQQQKIPYWQPNKVTKASIKLVPQIRFGNGKMHQSLCPYQNLGGFAGNQNNSSVAYVGCSPLIHHQKVLSEIDDDMILPDGEMKQGSAHICNTQ